MADFGGRYRLDRRLGAGGMGEVWLAFDEELDGRPVAIKKMHPHMLGDAEDVARFQREMRLASRMQHPNIMTVFTTGSDNGVPFMVVEYLEGSDLGQATSGGGADEVARIGRESCLALAYAHGLTPGVVYRDIKPGNLFRCSTGLVKIMDFGIAKAVSGTKLTTAGTLSGTLPYMAPEMWLSGEAAFSNDIWAVGCVLYWLLSGGPARSYQTPEEYVAAAARRERVAPLPGGVPGWLSSAVYRLLEPDPRQRPTAAQCVELLARPAAYSPPPYSPTQVSSPSPSRQPPSPPWSPTQIASPSAPDASPRPSPWAPTQDAAPRPPRPLPLPAQPVPARQAAPSAAAGDAPLSEQTARRVLDAGQRSGAFSPPATSGGRLPATTGRRSRRWFLIAAGGTGLAAVGGATAWKLLDGASPGPTGSGSGPGSGPVLLSKLPTSTSVNSVAFSPNGHTLAAGSGGNGGVGTVQLWNVTDPAHPVALGKPLTGLTYVNTVAFSPDGRTLAAGTGPGMIQLWNVTDPAHPVALGKPLTAPAQVVSVAFSPDGQILAGGSAPGGPVTGAIRLWNVGDPARPAALGYPAATAQYEVNSLAFSPSGHTLASANASSPALVQLWDVTHPAHVVLLGQAAVRNGVHSLTFSPDGHTLVSAGGEVNTSGGASSSAIERWNVTDPAHPAALGQPLTGPATPFNSVTFSPSGHTLAAGSGSPTFTAGAIQLWNVTDPAHPAVLGSPLNDDGGAIAAVAFSPDGRVLAGGNGNSLVDLWSAG